MVMTALLASSQIRPMTKISQILACPRTESSRKSRVVCKWQKKSQQILTIRQQSPKKLKKLFPSAFGASRPLRLERHTHFMKCDPTMIPVAKKTLSHSHTPILTHDISLSLSYLSQPGSSNEVVILVTFQLQRLGYSFIGTRLSVVAVVMWKQMIKFVVMNCGRKKELNNSTKCYFMLEIENSSNRQCNFGLINQIGLEKSENTIKTLFYREVSLQLQLVSSLIGLYSTKQ